MSRITLEPMHNGGETRNQVFDFSSQCAVGETLSVASVSATVYSGTDPTASSIISGSAAISGQKITQLIGGTCVAGVVYIITALVVTSTGQVLKLIGYLSCIPATQ